jgi:hypothetical protein
VVEDGCTGDLRVAATEFVPVRRLAAGVRVGALRADAVPALPAAVRPVVVRLVLGLVAVVRVPDVRAVDAVLTAVFDFAGVRLAATRFVVLRLVAVCFVVRLAAGRLAVPCFFADRAGAAFFVDGFLMAVFLAAVFLAAVFLVAVFFVAAAEAPARFAAGFRALEVRLLVARLLGALRAVPAAFDAARPRAAVVFAADLLVAFFAAVLVAFFAAPLLLADFLVVAIGLLRVGLPTE